MGAFLDSLPADTKDPAYNAAVLNAIRSGNFEILWGEVTSSYNGHTATFRVFADALKIEGVRINVSAQLEQQIADMLSCMLLTSKLADLIYYQRQVALAPVLLVQTAADLQFMSSVKYMLRHSKAIDDQLTNVSNATGLRCDVGKHWVNANVVLQHPGKAINYGFYSSTHQAGTYACATVGATPCFVFQPPPDYGSWAHDPGHIDYSQVCVLVSRLCMVDGQQMDLSAVLSDPNLAPLANADGVLKVLRQPGVSQMQAIVSKLPCVGGNCPSVVSWVGTDEMPRPSVKILIFSGAMLALVVGGFFGAMALAGHAHEAKKNPVEDLPDDLRPVLGTLSHNRSFTIGELRQYARNRPDIARQAATLVKKLVQMKYLYRGKDHERGTVYVPTERGWNWIEGPRANPRLETETAICECSHDRDTHAKIYTDDAHGNRSILSGACLAAFCNCKGYVHTAHPDFYKRGSFEAADYDSRSDARTAAVVQGIPEAQVFHSRGRWHVPSKPGFRARANPVQSTREPISPYVFEYRGVKTVIEKKKGKSKKWCYVLPGHDGRKPDCVPTFREAIIDVKQIVDSMMT